VFFFLKKYLIYEFIHLDFNVSVFEKLFPCTNNRGELFGFLNFFIKKNTTIPITARLPITINKIIHHFNLF